VHAQIVAYSGRDDRLFSRAIVESGTLDGPYPHPDYTPYQATYNALQTNTSCTSAANFSADQLACIRALPIDQFRSLYHLRHFVTSANFEKVSHLM
jgi:hypothetical protein